MRQGHARWKKGGRPAASRGDQRGPQAGRACDGEPVGDVLVRETMKGLRRMLGVASDQKRGVSTADVRAVVSRLGDRLIDRRDRAPLLVGFSLPPRR